MNIKIAICHNPRKVQHSGSWITPWIEYCEKNGFYYKLIDGLGNDIITQLKDFDILLWHFSGYSYLEMLMTRSVIYSAEKMGLFVFPGFNCAWHFDDKIAETYLLQSVNASIPRSSIFYSYSDFKYFIENNCRFPIVVKLRTGSGSHNVKLFNTKGEVIKYGRKMFGPGIKSSPDIFLKAKSNIVSTKNWRAFRNRFKRIPEFIRTFSRGKEFPREKGYVFLQEFVPNDGFDLKIVVVGDKLSYIGRHSRKNDFRASGSGDLFFDKLLVSNEIIESAFLISEKCGFQCMGYDYVVNKLTGESKIVEISYGFSHLALLQAGGYFNRNGDWFGEPLNAPEEVLKAIIDKIRKTDSF
jgi:glutathione synthase/RimK-type ligase-like ATP-grasp enzyme